jgi:hypothetical protein
VSSWAGLEERADHYLQLAGANIVATQALLTVRDNLADMVEAKAMMCVHGDAGLGKTLSVNASLRSLAPDLDPEDVCRVQFRARPTPRYIRHTLFDVLGLAGPPPTRPTEFDGLLKEVLGERFRVLVCDEAQWLSRECFEFWRHLWDDLGTDFALVFVGEGIATRCCAESRCFPAGSTSGRSSADDPASGPAGHPGVPSGPRPPSRT